MHRFLAVGLVLIMGMAAAPLVAAAQDVPTVDTQADRPAPWVAGVGGSFDHVSDGRAAWNSWAVSLKRRFETGTVMGELVRQSRFGVSDIGGRLDGWRDLWTGAWGHVRVGIGPRAKVYPQSTVLADLTQSVGAWELSAQYTWRTYATDETHAVRPQVAYYVGTWYLRGFAIAIPRTEEWAVTGGLSARRFLGGSQSYVDLTAGLGRSVEIVGVNAELLTERTAFVSVRTQQFFSPHMGVQAGLRYSDDGFFRRLGGSAGLLVRW